MLEIIDCAPFIEYETLRNEKNQVKGIKIEFVNIPQIVERIYPLIEPKNDLKNSIIHQQFNILGTDQKLYLATQMLITRYCIHRILVNLKLYSQEVWMYKTSIDYYGDEVQNICLKPQVAKKAEEILEKLKHQSPAEKIEQVLLLEYGYLIPSVTGKQWFIKKVPLSNIIFRNAEHHTQCRHELEENESFRHAVESLPYPRGITILNPDGTHKVIDGYHRLACLSEDQDALIIYCLRE